MHPLVLSGIMVLGGEKTAMVSETQGYRSRLVSLARGLKNLLGVGLYLLALGLILEGLAVAVQPWISFPISLALGFPTLFTVLFVAVSLLAMGAVLWMLLSLAQNKRVEVVALSLIFGGALGNVVDRARLGEVVDFIDVYYDGYHWPAFNVADSAISIGVIILLWRLLSSRE